MNIISRYLNSGIEGFSYAEFKRILEGTHSVKVKMASSGIFILDNGRTIKCAKEYYRPEGGKSIEKLKKKVSNECFYIQKELGISGVSSYNCVDCHYHCLHLKEDEKLCKR
jgi:hypothetical protein